MTNKKDERIRKLWERGVRNLKVIARKIGYQDETSGVARVEEGLKRLKLQ